MASMTGMLWDWLPDTETVLADVRFVPTRQSDREYLQEVTFQGMNMSWRVGRQIMGAEPQFSATYWTRLTAEHWEVPVIATIIYLMSIPALRSIVTTKGKFDVKRLAFWWNLGLSLFSCAGVVACVPVLLDSLSENGLFFTICAPPAWYGTGVSGFFVALFVYSKLWELGDTVLLLLAAKPVIALQWWHHSTVLLYCWHSYATRIATGAWFACMNYTVHSVMYAYFAATTTSYRKVVQPFAIYITFLQLAQMVVGIYVTVRAVLYQATGQLCYVNKTNSILGLAMYASYFVLFLKLFIENYCLKRRANPAAVKAPPAAAAKPAAEAHSAAAAAAAQAKEAALDARHGVAPPPAASQAVIAAAVSKLTKTDHGQEQPPPSCEQLGNGGAPRARRRPIAVPSRQAPRRRVQ